ncbi:MAG: FHA domain-containing protein [Desulfobulbaceae bacterium]|nr:FHA domain-containing protein [Desulfobulbaceae bacterium]
MATISVKYNNKVLYIQGLEPGRPFTIGRLAENDIMIDNVAVSGKHAQIVSDASGFIIQDLGSKNGIFIDNKPVKSRRLNDGDVVIIGKHELLYSNQGLTAQVDVSAIQRHSTLTPDNPTAFLDTRNQQEMLQTFNRFSNRVPLIEVKLKGKLIYKHLLKKDKATIGRNPESSIVIDNTAVSYDHAVIIRENNEFYIEDLRSKNGTLVNNKPIKKYKLHNGDLIIVGRHELLFEEEGTFTLNEIGAPKVDQSNYISGTMVLKTTVGQKPSLTYINGGQGKVVLEKKITTLGKSDECDIVAKGLMVGDVAAQIVAESDGYYLSYQNGFTKPSVNGQAVKGSVKLKSSDLIEIGSVTLRFRLMG